MNEREQSIYDSLLLEDRMNADRLFAKVLLCQWIACIAIALLTTPFTWDGLLSSLHPHLIAAIFLGGALTIYPTIQMRLEPGARENGYIVTVAQMLYSILFIHITGGRLESHFHIFGSLAFLTFYKNERLIWLATAITAIDHIARGAFFPESVYGVSDATIWRAVEHSAWVFFEDVFLIIAVRSTLGNKVHIAEREFALERAVANQTLAVEERTNDLLQAQFLLKERQQRLVNAERLSSLGEMAAGIAHEINNPLAIIASTTLYLRKLSEKGKLDGEKLTDCLDDVDETVKRMSKIIMGLRNISRDAEKDVSQETTLNEIFTDVLAVCHERFKNHSITFRLSETEEFHRPMRLNRVQISQVFMNLLSNAFDAVKDRKNDRWIQVRAEESSGSISIFISDSGPGVPVEVRAKIFQPFFTTKEVGKGTGLGLSLSKSIIERHGGTLSLSESVSHTEFSVCLPLKAG